MRVKAPPPFMLKMAGTEGLYTLRYAPDPNDEWEGRIEVDFPGETTWWPVHRVDDDGTGPALGGIAGLDTWDSSYWFSLKPEAEPPRIEYWADQIIWRVDQSVDPDAHSSL